MIQTISGRGVPVAAHSTTVPVVLEKSILLAGSFKKTGPESDEELAAAVAESPIQTSKRKNANKCPKNYYNVERGRHEGEQAQYLSARILRVCLLTPMHSSRIVNKLKSIKFELFSNKNIVLVFKRMTCPISHLAYGHHQVAEEKIQI